MFILHLSYCQYFESAQRTLSLHTEFGMGQNTISVHSVPIHIPINIYIYICGKDLYGLCEEIVWA